MSCPTPIRTSSKSSHQASVANFAVTEATILSLASNGTEAAYLEGKGVDQDRTKASALYRKACKGDHQVACSSLDNMGHSL